jgi:hypothetical protein
MFAPPPNLHGNHFCHLVITPSTVYTSLTEEKGYLPQLMRIQYTVP